MQYLLEQKERRTKEDDNGLVFQQKFLPMKEDLLKLMNEYETTAPSDL